MCGLIAYLGKGLEANKHHLSSMLDQIEHRGPDGRSEVFIENCAYFGHVRLAVIDIDNAKQPMVSECGRYTLVYNGEIYNYLELRQELIKSGVKFKGYGDTEVLLNLLIKEGRKCLNKLNGMFSFIFYDKLEKSWIAGRDHFGIKPLYYYEYKNGDIVFASEIKALFCLNTIKPQCNSDILFEYLQFQFSLDNETLFKGVKKLKPACYMLGSLYENHVRKQNKWWNVEYKIDEEHNEDWFFDRLNFLILDSIQLQTRSDVSLGSYLSGGLDSSLISVLASNYLNITIPCFHGKFDQYKDYDESEFANQVVNSSNLVLNEVSPSPEDFINEISDIIRFLDEPLAGPGVFPQYIVSKLASKEVKVVLGGQGGDELFCGYTKYQLAYFEQALKGAINETQEEGKHLVTLDSIIPNLPGLKKYIPLMKKFINKDFLGPMNERYFHLISRSKFDTETFNNDFLKNFDYEKQFEKFNNLFLGTESKSYINKMTNFDMQTLLPALLHIEDRVSMAWGLESRVPLLDYRIAEFIATVPPKYKFSGAEPKSMLKRFSKSYLPDSVLKRKDKMGFPVPLKEWSTKGIVRDFISDTLSTQKCINRGIFNKVYLRNIVDSINEPAARDIWGALSLEIWHNQFLDL